MLEQKDESTVVGILKAAGINIDGFRVGATKTTSKTDASGFAMS